jgi:nitroimidazol reductase NimA-like FMN-containing flavoprotein (pyridoxamine 5'-phosphate oxidase superfamily)
MMRTLGTEEVKRVLLAEVVGRIGAHADGRTYVVPVAYVFDDDCIYAHSSDGMKIQMMRQNPSVCFEVDHVEDLVNWHSVIGWGTYEELHAEAAQRGLELLSARLRARFPGPAVHDTSTEAPAVVFRLKLTEMTGREERLYWQLLVPPVTV